MKDGYDMAMVELMRELEFPSKPGGLVLAAVMVVENLECHSAIRLGGRVCPVHGGVSAPSHGGVDDVTFELLADGKHDPSLGPQPGKSFSRHDYFCAVSRR